MAGKIQLQQAFQKTYELPLFIKSILYPVFTNRVKIYQSPVIETNKANTTELRIIKSVKCYGQIDLDDTTTVKCYEILLNPGVRLEYNKVSIQQYVRKLLTAGQAILVNFQQPEDKNVWRLSLVASDSKIIDDKIEQVKTNAKRYTYLLGPSETCRTASERFAELEALKDISLDNLVKAFSVEKLSKSFFDEYKLHYQAFNSYLINSNFRSSAFGIEKQKDENAAEYKPIRDFVKKTLGRIVFLFFVQKKGWLAASTTKYVDGDLNFIMNLFQKSGANETFYPNHLCKLFFEALNTQRTGDLYTLHFKDGKKEVVCVPFLNGGLFEKEKFDNKTITFPAKLFHNKANDEDPKHRGFLDFLNAFNFTIYEDSPDDHTVAVDPEMLGHIFENLLEDNKDKGAYYTPKEIVHYMCQESLIEYLNTKLNVFEVPLGYTDKGLKTAKPKSKPQQLALTQTDVRDNIKRQEIEDFVKNKNANEFIFQNAKAIDGLLDTVKVCDPAIGSGAVTMGLMQEIFALKMVLHDFVFTTSNELFHLKDYDPQNYRSNVKLNIIQNSIYGVDIEHGAVDIARLRFWLSLIVDEQIPKALPNLDYKILTGNSLVSKFDDEVIDIDWEVKAGTDATKKLQQQIHSNLEKLFAKQKLFFNYKGDKPKLQNEIRNLKIEVLISQLQLDKYKYSQKSVSNISLFEQTAKQKQQTAETTTQLAGYDKAVKKLEKLKEQPNKPLDFFDWKLNFPEVMNKELNPDNGFDIVIGNPPYLNFKMYSSEDKEVFKRTYPAIFDGKAYIYYYFFICAAQLAKSNAFITFITSRYWL
ncbi:MAG: Eco57I restriction-modification methylase domain-containing protein, partial [Bacteroidetes bacterium]|nr:Eco57I restriction-modification methylase domain-containing protein [Bacteroidota bacterium]